MEINDDNYYQVQGWMLNRLEIKGNDLLVFAIIYGFSQDGKGLYSGSLQYLQKFTGSSKNTVMSSLKFLCEKGFIIRDDLIVNDVVFPRYKFNTQFARGVQKLNWGGAEIERGGGAEIAPNNKELYNKEYNKDSSFENFQFSDSEIKTDSDLKEKKGKEKSCVKKESEPVEVIPHPCVLNEEYGTWVEMHGDGELHNMLADFYKQNQTKYEGKMYEGFKAYWTAKVINGKDKGKELWRTQKTFSVAGRLATWSNNYKPQSNGINNNQTRQLDAINKAKEAMAIVRERDRIRNSYSDSQ